MEKRDSAKVSQFSIVDTKEWNDDVKQRNKQKAAATATNNNKDCTDVDPKQHKQ